MLTAIAGFGTLVTLLVLVFLKDEQKSTNLHPFHETQEEVWPPKVKFSMKEELRMLRQNGQYILATISVSLSLLFVFVFSTCTG